MLNRLKTRLFSALAALFITGTAALGAGTTPLALVPQLDSSGNVASGCLLYFYQAGTVATRQDSFVDFGLTTPNAWPLPCDQAGRVPMHWLADGLIHIRLTDSGGVVIVDTTMQVLGPSSGGGGGGGTVDPTTLLATGDLKVRYGTGPLAGYVRANGLTLGNATSGATERANADTQNLFVYLYNADPNLVVSGGRTGNALNDYNANKTIALPDWRGRAIAALDDMGNAPAGNITATYFGPAATVLGAAGGNQATSLFTSNLPPYTPSGTITGGTISASTTNQIQPGAGATPFIIQGGGSISLATEPVFTGTAQGGTNVPFSNIMPAKLATVYVKL